MQNVGFYARLYAAALKARTEYRLDFAVGVVTAVGLQLAALAFYWVVFSRVPALGGWSADRVLFLFGLTALVLGVSELFLNGIWMVPWYLMGGELDRLLVYPVHSLAFVLTSRPELHALGNLAVGALTVGVAWSNVAPPWPAFLLLPVWVASGTIVYTALLVVAACLSFTALGPWSQHLMIVHHLLNASRYPVSIYPRWLQTTLLVGMPVSTSIFVPAEWLAGERHILAAALVPPLAALVSGAVAVLAWNRALRTYQSTGS